MPYIYKIINNINNKIYIGKTIQTVETRWKEHKRECNQARAQNRPLYAAFRKYGIDNFSIEQVEETTKELLEEREKYWIEFYKSFKYGYNATKGGDGRPYLDYDLVVQTYKELQSCKAVAQQLHIDEGHVRTILHACGEEVIHHGAENLNLPRIVNMYDLQNNYIQTFSSCSAAVKWCVENGFCKKESSGARGHISNCARGKEKSAFKHIWKYPEEN